MDRLATAISNLNTCRYVSVAGTTLWAYDYLLTCKAEVTRIWPAKWSLVKVLFLTTRYIAVPYIAIMMYYLLGPPVSTPFCKLTIVIMTIIRPTELITETWLVMIRVRALYIGHARTLWILYGAFIITHTCNIAITIQSMIEVLDNLSYSPFLRLCVAKLPRFAKVFYFIQLPLEFTLLAMQLAHYWNISRALSPVRPTLLLTTLYRDGVIYFMAIVTLRVWAGLVIAILDPSYYYMTMVLDLGLSATFISRLVLHLNKVYLHDRNRAAFSTCGVTTTVSFGMPCQPADRHIEMHPHPCEAVYLESANNDGVDSFK